MKLQQIEQMLSSFQKKEILIIGDVGLDIYTTGDVHRISPEAPVPILQVKEKTYKLGLAANVSDNIQELLATPVTLGVVGNDHACNQLYDLFTGKKISPQYLIKDLKRPTIAKERITTIQQQIVRVDYESTAEISQETFEKVLSTLSQIETNSKVCILQDYGKGFFTAETTPQIIKILKKKKYKILLDPNTKSDLSWFEGVDLVKPNNLESQNLTHIKPKSDSDYKRISDKIKDLTQASEVVITRGAEGINIFDQKNNFQKIPAFAREVFDVSGAGDTFIAVLSLCMANNYDLFASAYLANLTSAIEVGKRGTATVTPAEIIQEAKHHLNG